MSSANARYLKLSSALLYRIHGRHATRYLHSRLTQNVSSIPVGAGKKSALTDASAKVIALFTILRESEDSYLFLCDGGSSDEIAAALLQFRVAEDVTLDILSDYQLIHVAPLDGALETPHLEEPGSPSEITWNKQGELVLVRCQRLQAKGVDILAPRSTITDYTAKLDQNGATLLTDAEHTAERVLANAPIFPLDLVPGALLSEVDLDTYASFTKGCYVGQEVLEKISARGKAPQKLFPVVLGEQAELHGNDTLGLAKTEEEENALLGKLLVAAYDTSTGKTYGFARLKNRDNLSGKPVLVNGSLGQIL